MLFNLYRNGFHLNSFSPHMVRRHGGSVLLSVIFAGVIGCFVVPRKDLLRTSKLRCFSSPAGAFNSGSSFWEVANDAARDDGVSAATYLQKINHTASAFISKRTPVDREDAIDCLNQLMATKGSVYVVIGGNNLGKTLLKEAAIKRCGANLAMLEVNMRDADMLGKSMMEALDLQRRKSLRRVLLLAELAAAMIRFPSEFLLDKFGVKTVERGGEAAKGLVEIVSRAQVSVDNFIRKSVRRKKIPCIIVDEANKALPGLTERDGSAEANSALAAITRWTKETDQASVILISSEFGYPFRLLENGLNLRTIKKVIVIGEVPEADMMKMLQEEWGMTNSLAKKFYEYFGGDIYTTKQALDSLIEKKDKFDPYAVMNVPGLPSLCEDPEARAHLENIARQGFSLVKNVKTDRAARMIAEENVGGVINKQATTFGLPEIFTDKGRKWAVIPSTYHMRMMIVHELENTPLPSSGRGGGKMPHVFFLGGGIKLLTGLRYP